MRNPVYRPQWVIILTSVVVAGMSVASSESFPAFFAKQHPALAGQTSSASGVPALHGIVDSGRNADLRWSDFTPYKTEVAKLYATNGYSLLWVQNGRVRPQGLAVIELLQNADLKGLDPEDYDGSRWQGRLLKLDQKKLDQEPSEQRLGLLRYRAYSLGDALHPRHPLWPRKSQGIQVSARYGRRTTPVGGIHLDPGRECRRSSRRNSAAGTALHGLPEAARALAGL
jgi:hypothetical protein